MTNKVPIYNFIFFQRLNLKDGLWNNYGKGMQVPFKKKDYLWGKDYFRHNYFTFNK